MNRSKVFVHAAAGFLLLLAQASCAAQTGASLAPDIERLENTSPMRILFVGNSYLYYNDSLHNHVRRIVAELDPQLADDIQYKSATIGGARLSHHHIDSLLEPGRLGFKEPFELVILQGGSGEVQNSKSRAQFRKTAMEMSAKIRATGAEVALYMT
ncbi:MAG: hypothetical protein WBM68_09585, partial [Woeseia sp.]